MDENICRQHSGFSSEIESLHNENLAQWASIRACNLKTDTMLTKLNVILTGVVIACIMLVINLIINHA